MKFYISEYAGLCSGAAQALQETYNSINLDDNLWMYGEVLHNPIVMSELLSLGCNVLNDIEDVPENATVLIRAHGVPRIILDEMKSKNAKILDKTCPNIKKIHNIVKTSYSERTRIIIFGESNHPEVIGIKGWCSSNPFIFSNKEEYLLYQEKLRGYEKLVVVFQTTFDQYSFQEIEKLLIDSHENMEIHNTICKDSYKRQEEVKRISKQCDFVVIIGGKNSSNTRKLYRIASDQCETVYIENAKELNLDRVKKHKNIGIFNGASTPLSIVQEVIKLMKEAVKFEEDEIIFY